jgi:glycosyltransferase involved in cell wall biosynthesis
MENKQLVSIVIPTYNQQEQFLRQCIESAVNQTYKNIEVLISDNHSNNGSSEIIAEYANKDNRIRVIKPKQFLSLADNFSFAYENVSGEYICPLSSDDILYPEIVQTLLAPYEEHPDLSFSYSLPNYFKNKLDKDNWKPRKFKSGFYDSSIFIKEYVTSEHGMYWGGIVFKTSNFIRIGGFSKEINYLGDNDCIIKLILLGGGVYYVNQPLSAIRRWDRDEQTDRTPYGLMDCGKTYAYLENAVTINKQVLTPKQVRKIRKRLFWHEVFPIPYLLYSKKRKVEIINKTAEVVKDNYPNNKMFNFILQNRNNYLGIFLSIYFLSIHKIKYLLLKKY